MPPPSCQWLNPQVRKAHRALDRPSTPTPMEFIMSRRITLILGCVFALSTLGTAQGVVAPYTQDFESFAPFTLSPGIGSTGLGAEWDYAQPAGGTSAQARVQASSTPLPPVGGPQVLVLDAPMNNVTETNEVVLHIDGIASDLGSGFAITFLLKETGDETNPEDVIVITDGLTPGNGVDRLGNSTGLPGYGGHQEFLLLDWNTALSTAGGGPGNNAWKEFTFIIDANFYATSGLIPTTDMRLVFRQRDNFGTPSDGLFIDNVRVIDAGFTDVSVTSVDAPVTPSDCSFLTTSEVVTATLTNVGLQTIPTGTMIPVFYDVDNGAQTAVETLTLTADLTMGQSVQYTFTATADLSAPGSHLIQVTSFLTGDGDITNDTGSTTVLSGGTSQFPFLETFDTFTTVNNTTDVPSGWLQDQADNAGGTNSDWFFRNTPTTSANTGPPADHTTGVSGMGFYGYVEDSGNFSAVNLLTPCFDISSLSTPTLRFYVHSNNSQGPGGANENFLALDIVDPNGTVMDIISPIGHLGNSWQEVLVDLSPYAAQAFRIQFRGRSDGGSFTHDIAIDDVEVFDNVTPDLAMQSIDAPVANLDPTCGTLGSNVTVSVTIQNAGVTLSAGQILPVQYTVDDGVNPVVTVSEALVLQAALPPGGTVPYTFTQGADLSVQGLYTFTASVLVPGDSNPANDTTGGHQVQSGGANVVNTFPFFENFDTFTTMNQSTTPPADWLQDQSDATGSNSDWFFRNTATTSTGTGPSADHTTGMSGVGFYAYVEDSGGNFPMVNLLTPCFDTSSLNVPFLSFWYHSFNNGPDANQNFLHVDVIDDTTQTIHLDVMPPIGTVENAWKQAGLLLGPWASPGFRIRFRVDSTNGGANTFTHDIAIDDVMVGEAPPLGNGQPETPGIAGLDINNATEANGFGVASGFPGPFMTQVVGGTENLNFSIRGEPNQSFILLAGPLNVGALLAPPQGQFDIGNTNPMPPFIPTGLTVVWNGFDLAFPAALYNTGATGEFVLTMPSPAIPGLNIGFQAILATSSGTVVKFTNAVDLTIL